MEIGARIKEVRAHKELKLSDFGAKIEISESHLSKIEKSARPANDRIIKLICNEFNVNEEWLRFGTGTMYNERPSANKVLMSSFTRIIKEDDKKKASIIMMMDGMTDEEVSALYIISKSMTK